MVKRDLEYKLKDGLEINEVSFLAFQIKLKRVNHKKWVREQKKRELIVLFENNSVEG